MFQCASCMIWSWECFALYLNKPTGCLIGPPRSNVDCVHLQITMSFGGFKRIVFCFEPYPNSTSMNETSTLSIAVNCKIVNIRLSHPSIAMRFHRISTAMESTGLIHRCTVRIWLKTKNDAYEIPVTHRDSEIQAILLGGLYNQTNPKSFRRLFF